MPDATGRCNVPIPRHARFDRLFAGSAPTENWCYFRSLGRMSLILGSPAPKNHAAFRSIAGTSPVPSRAKGQAIEMTSPVRGRPRRRWRWVALTALLDRRGTDRGAALAARDAGSAAPIGCRGQQDPGTELGRVQRDPALVVPADRDLQRRAPRCPGRPAGRRPASHIQLEPLADLGRSPQDREPHDSSRATSTSSASPTARSIFTRRSGRSSPSIPRSGS